MVGPKDARGERMAAGDRTRQAQETPPGAARLEGALAQPLTAAVTPLVRPVDPALGAEAAARLEGGAENVVALARGIAGTSPYLRMLIEKEGPWLAEAVGKPPEEVLAALTTPFPPDLPLEEIGRALRRRKRRLHLYVAFADLGGAWALLDVTGALTRLADFAVDQAIRHLVHREAARGHLPGVTAEEAFATGGGLVALAMGKMGGFELNYSSDIDLVMLFDDSRWQDDAAALAAVRQRFVRITRRLVKLLSEVTGEGYVFRTDLRLRPDPSVTPVCLSMEAAERYYESVGRGWERAAFIKARAAAGDIAAGEAFLARLSPFVWRRHLDYAAIAETREMQLRIRSHKGYAPIRRPENVRGHDIKLGPGGIREIEFFVQTHQMIFGGRDRSLRVRGTLDALDRLAAAGRIERAVADALGADYVAHRTLEHRLQMLHDAQTHRLPLAEEEMERVAALRGTGRSRLEAEVAERLERVHRLTEVFFAGSQGAGIPPPPPLPAALAQEVERWRLLPPLRSSRAQEIFARIEPLILRALLRAADPEMAFSGFTDFLAGLPAGVQLFSLFDANRHLIDLIADILGVAPALGRHLANHPSVLEAVITGDFFAPLPPRERLEAELRVELAAAGDYETALRAARRWQRETHFRIGVHLLTGHLDALAAGRAWADLAEAVLAALWPVVVAEFARKHGDPPGRGAAVIGMGSLGGRVLTARSDLDLIVVFDAPLDAVSEGPRPLDARRYHARLTQALITALGAPMREGVLYEVDMRLRPSGRQGPVATALAAFENYQLHEAWGWEHLALTRARPVAGSRAVGEEVMRVRERALAAAAGRPGRILSAVAAMRARLAASWKAETVADPWEAKAGPGRRLDIELLAEAGAILSGERPQEASAQIATLPAAGLVREEEAARLARAHADFVRLQEVARLVTEGRFDPGSAGEGGRALLLRELGAPSLETARAGLEAHRAEAAAIIDRVLEGVSPGDGPPGRVKARGAGSATSGHPRK